MKTSSSNINESVTLKSEKVYYHNGKFLFLKGDKWPEEPKLTDYKYFPGFKDNEKYTAFQQSLTSALKEAVEFEDQRYIEALVKMMLPDRGAVWNCPQEETLYTIPEQRVEIVEVDTVEDGGGCFVAGSKTVARLVPSSLEKQETDFKASNIDDPNWKIVSNAFHSYTHEGAINFLINQGFTLQKQSPSTQENKTLQQHDCEFFLVTNVAVYACECDPHRIQIDNEEYVNVKSLHREDQEELCKEVAIKCNSWGVRYAAAQLQKNYIITRKGNNG